MTFEEMAQELGVSKESKNLQILATGFNGVKIRDFIDVPQTFVPDKMSEILRKWIRKIRAGDFVYDGSLASISAFWVNEQQILEFILRRSRYILYVGTREKSPREIKLHQLPLDEHYCLPLSFGAITITKDNYIVLGLRSKKEDIGKEKVGSIPAGYLNPDVNRVYIKLIGNSISFESLILEELREEVGIETYTSKEYLALIQDKISSQQPLVAIRLKIPFSKEELEAVGHTGWEHTEYIYIKNSKSEIRKAFKRYQFTPHSLGTIICHCFM